MARVWVACTPVVATVLLFLTASVNGTCGPTATEGAAKITCLPSDQEYPLQGLYTSLEAANNSTATSVEIEVKGISLDNWMAYDLLAAVFDVSGGGRPVTLALRGVNMTGTQLDFLHAFGGAANPEITLLLEDSIIVKNQFVAFGALMAKNNLKISVVLTNSQVLDNQLTAAVAVAAGGLGEASVQIVNSVVSGNTLSAAGALAIGTTGTAKATGMGGSAVNNMVSVAAFIATGGVASGTAEVSSIPSENNTVIGTGLAFTEDALVDSILETVKDAVYFKTSTLEASLTNVQAQLCVSMAPSGKLAGVLDELSLGAVLRVANALLCTPNSGIKISDIPGMISGSGSAGSLSTMRALSLLAMGKGQVTFKSMAGLAKVAAQHPGALAAIVGQLTVVPK